LRIPRCPIGSPRLRIDEAFSERCSDPWG
jgi:hypothetical protein